MKSSALEQQLGLQLKAAGISFIREHVFCPWRKFRADLWIIAQVLPNGTEFDGTILVEVQGFSPSGHHGSAFVQVHKDCEKASLAAVMGYRIVYATGKQIRDGSALAWIEAALGLRQPETLETVRKPRRSQRRTARLAGKVITKTLANKRATRALPAHARKAAGL